MNNEVSCELPERSSSPAKNYHEPPPAPFIGTAELKKWALIAEFVTTLLLLYIGMLTIIGFVSEKAKNYDDPCSGVGLLGIAWAFGGMVFILVYCIVGIWKISLIRGLLYIVVQYLGAICGVLYIIGIFSGGPFTGAITAAIYQLILRGCKWR
ncbi:hypothetical protein RDI58_014225 [Solanum bulbocastanum]|uniref:Uncharacterized protein n=1 Tax=Solanum bulbocastanum TaxID=147425 RepID=A0AAN8TNN6_SOLBU